MSEIAPAKNYRRFFRQPDSAFWLDLLQAAPGVTPADQLRRERLTRYALGGALVLTLPYIVLSLLLAPHETRYIVFLNLAGVIAYACGMWAASLGAMPTARTLLMTTLTAQLATLVWLTGPVLGVSVFAFVAAALGRVLFAPHEKTVRLFFVGLSFLILVGGFVVGDRSYSDFSTIPSGVLAFARTANAILAFSYILLVLGVFDKEVLRSEAGLVAERDRSNRLLHVILPPKIAETLQHSNAMIADHHPEVTVLFADIVGFTPWAAKQSPQQVVSMLEKIFSRFDALVAVEGAEKIKTIGDAYMMISGAPGSREDHAAVMARLALAFFSAMEALQKETGLSLTLRIGMSTGAVIAGVIGTVRFSYDVWGDTVNTASRMESHGEPGRIHVTAETMSRLAIDFDLEKRGNIDIKGKGTMETWWLLGEKH